ncbi:helix-turn-helix domain-containing protein [Nonomuraea sp. NPDC052129]|uniref:helix-turn-helix domain-containing protein n=1 Tax=Nonomuraea sp. NPDC052129 TaxID=3154651 RepID=UPI003443C828
MSTYRKAAWENTVPRRTIVTSGQLYHHLRALQSARLITQRRRGEYELAPQAMPQVVSILAAAFDLAHDPPLFPPIDLPSME